MLELLYERVLNRMRARWLVGTAALLLVLSLVALALAPPTEVTEDDALAAFREQLAADTAGEATGGVEGIAPSPVPTEGSDTTGDAGDASEVPTPTTSTPVPGGAAQDGGTSDTTASEPTPAPSPPPAQAAVPTRPAQGVYSFSVDGGESLDVPGGSRSYPPNATSTLVHDSDACGWTVEMALAEEHRDLLAFCTSKGSAALRRVQQYVEFLGVSEIQDFRCSPALVVPLTAGGPASRGRCTAAEAGVTGDFVITTTEERARTVDGTSVPAIRVIYEVTFSGNSEGSSTVDTWVHAQTGLLLHMERTTDTMIETQAGRRRYQEDVTVDLKSLTPRT